jgi:hypothetical protein
MKKEPEKEVEKEKEGGRMIEYDENGRIKKKAVLDITPVKEKEERKLWSKNRLLWWR